MRFLMVPGPRRLPAPSIGNHFGERSYPGTDAGSSRRIGAGRTRDQWDRAIGPGRARYTRRNPDWGTVSVARLVAHLAQQESCLSPLPEALLVAPADVDARELRVVAIARIWRQLPLGPAYRFPAVGRCPAPTTPISR